MRHDIEESSKWFALERYSAALFHILLVAEFGVIEAAKLFGAQGDKPGWGALDRLQRINDKKWDDKTPLEQQQAEFLRNLLPDQPRRQQARLRWIPTSAQKSQAKSSQQPVDSCGDSPKTCHKKLRNK